MNIRPPCDTLATHQRGREEEGERERERERERESSFARSSRVPGLRDEVFHAAREEARVVVSALRQNDETFDGAWRGFGVEFDVQVSERSLHSCIALGGLRLPELWRRRRREER